jgi:hypothetical protein
LVKTRIGEKAVSFKPYNKYCIPESESIAYSTRLCLYLSYKHSRATAEAILPLGLRRCKWRVIRLKGPNLIRVLFRTTWRSVRVHLFVWWSYSHTPLHEHVGQHVRWWLTRSDMCNTLACGIHQPTCCTTCWPTRSCSGVWPLRD